MNKKMIVANWKMYRPYDESIAWSTKHRQDLLDIASKAHIILCPEFTALAEIARLFKSTAIVIGAQNCSYFETGATTGEVSVISLSQMGCSLCIVGHWERYHFFGETIEHVLQKINLLKKYSITPIVCVNDQDLDLQLGQLSTLSHTNFIIAYEPVASIGTGIIPEIADLENTLSVIRNSFSPEIQLLYGGSVNPETAQTLAKIKQLDGYLIGGASLDFQNFKNIVESVV